MSQADKSRLWQILKAAGVQPSEHYREYTTEDLQAAVDKLTESGYEIPDEEVPQKKKEAVQPQQPVAQEAPAPPVPPAPPAPPQQPAMQIPHSNTRVHTHAGEAAYTPNMDEQPIRVDDEGRVWFREEVRKPASPTPRARRKLTYIDTGVEQIEVRSDTGYVETVEVAGKRTKTSEVKITMPSYQVGVYLDPRLPFKIHIYNEVRGFDLFDVQKFYGGQDLVPAEIKRLYVANDLCYDIQSTLRAIEAEHRRMQLQGVIR